MNHLLLRLLLITTIWDCNYAAVGEKTQAETDKQRIEEFENSFLKNLRNDYHNACQKTLAFFDSINKTMTALTKEILNLNAIANSNFKSNGNWQTAVAGSKSKTKNNNTKVQNLETRLELNFASTKNSLQRITLKTGKSFNESSQSEIKSLASSASCYGHTAVVFANYLDETVNDFTIYDKHQSIYNPAPTSVPAQTEEVFTFAGKKSIKASFSYVIPSNGVRVAAILWHGVQSAGLAFVPKCESMKAYFDSGEGIEGSSDVVHNYDEDRNISVVYNNLAARGFVDGGRSATIRIELMNLS